MTFFNLFKHLLPSAKAWSLTVDKNLRDFFLGLSGFGTDAKEFFDEVWLDIFPQTTRYITRWESQFGIIDSGVLTEQQRRDRLDTRWATTGGQSPSYIQNTLQDNGFDVYVHEWWVPGSEPAVGVKACVTSRNPITSLAAGYVLVNIISIPKPKWLCCGGDTDMEGGEPRAQGGEYDLFTDERLEYDIPTDTTKWPYFLYIGASTFGVNANIDADRRLEFETLCLKICPAHLWLGMLITYV